MQYGLCSRLIRFSFSHNQNAHYCTHSLQDGGEGVEEGGEGEGEGEGENVQAQMQEEAGTGTGTGTGTGNEAKTKTEAIRVDEDDNKEAKKNEKHSTSRIHTVTGAAYS